MKPQWISVLAFLLISNISHADQIPALVDLLNSEVLTLSNAVSSCAIQPTLQVQDDPSEIWFHKNLWIRMRPRGGFSIPGFLTIQIVPEFELLFQRDNPNGWDLYQPPQYSTRQPKGLHR